MRVNGITFVGIMGAILMSSANAENITVSDIEIASTKYVERKVDEVDAKIENKVDVSVVGDVSKLNGTTLVERIETVAGTVGGIDTESFATKNELDAEVGALSESILNARQVANTASEKATMALTDIGDKSQLNTVAKDNVVAAINELADKTASDADVTELKTTVAGNVEKIAAIETKFDKTIPMPDAACRAASGRCVLSIKADGTGLMWVSVTEPFGDTATDPSL